MKKCEQCGMPAKDGEYHPFAACLMYDSCKCSTTVRANLQAIIDRAKPKWQPIETAPKDGTRIIVWLEHNPKLGHDPSYSHATTAYWTDFNNGGWVWHGICGNITHWMPLPDDTPQATVDEE